MAYLLLFYWAFSAIFSLGAADLSDWEKEWERNAIRAWLVLIAPLMFPLMLGWKYKESNSKEN